MIVLVLLYTGLFTLADLLSSILFSSDPSHQGIELIRWSRDGLAGILAVWGGIKAWRGGVPSAFAALYLTLILGYVLLMSDAHLDESIVFASALKLALPVMMLAVGFGALDTPSNLKTYCLFLAALSALSAVFGAWDIVNTDFWTERLQYGHYLHAVKGVLVGFDDYYVLPFNFFGYEQARRAAGLVAAPLAQGSFVAVGSLVGFALLRGRFPIPSMGLLGLGLLGVWQSGTRGAMVMTGIALALYLLGARGGMGKKLGNVGLLLALFAVGAEALLFVYSYTVNFDDGSTIGHWHALMDNIRDLDQVLFLGPGVGASGSVAADAGLEIAGGGEGALFAIIYQIGLPGGLVFLLLYAAVMIRALGNRELPGATGDICLAGFALAVGAATSLISSDHLLTLSGMGHFWILLGGIAAQTVPAANAAAATEKPK